MQNLLDDLKGLLKQDERLVVDGKLLKNKIIELALQLDPFLLKMLLSHESIKKHFFQDVEGVLVFDKIKFQRFVSNKAFLPDSYTSFKNRIGLMDDDGFINEKKDVVLAWPYKDCVLEGEQKKEVEKRNEKFWNEILAPDDIDRLFEPKVMSNWKRFDRDGVHQVKNLSIKDNYLIKGNNLLALHSLNKLFNGSVKQIYIDPPYNTGNDSFNYNDSFNHSTWLTFMKSRLEVARDLLSKEGSLWINIDDGESHYLKVLCDQIFGRENFLINFIWQKKYSPSNDAKFFSDNHDHILVYAKDKDHFKANLLPRTDEMNSRYKNLDNDPRGPWKPGGLSVKTYSKDYDYPIETPSGKIVYPPEGSCWQTSKENFLKKLEDNRIWFGKNNNAKPQLKQFLSETQQGMVAKSIWLHDEVSHNQVSRSEIIKYLGEYSFSTPKPEKLLKRIIELGSNENDLILDFFAGSGTTQSVALKMNRRFIGIEQMDYINTVTVERLKKVIDGIDVGISKEVNWKGGNSFVYAELLPLNKVLYDKVNKLKTKEELLDFASMIFDHQLINYKVKFDNIPNFLLEIKNTSIDNIRKLLIEIIDSNFSYVPYSEILDKDYAINNDDIELTTKFYNLRK